MLCQKIVELSTCSLREKSEVLLLGPDDEPIPKGEQNLKAKTFQEQLLSFDIVSGVMKTTRMGRQKVIERLIIKHDAPGALKYFLISLILLCN